MPLPAYIRYKDRSNVKGALTWSSKPLVQAWWKTAISLPSEDPPASPRIGAMLVGDGNGKRRGMSGMEQQHSLGATMAHRIAWGGCHNLGSQACISYVMNISSPEVAQIWVVGRGLQILCCTS